MRFQFEILFLANFHFSLMIFIRDFIHDICFILIRNFVKVLPNLYITTV